MDLGKVKAQIADLKDKIVDNLDKNFNDFILEDIFDSGEYDIIDNLIDDFDWYIYWKWQASELREIFYILFAQKELTPDYHALLNDCMELKKVTDKHILANPYFEKKEYYKWLGISKKYNEDHESFIPLMEDNSSNFQHVELLYQELHKHGFIQCALESFKSHFKISDSKIKPIKWYGTEIKIIALFSLLIDKGIFHKSIYYRKAHVIARHFLNRKGKIFKIRQLSVSQSKYSHDETQHLYEDISKIVNQLAEIN